MGTITELATSAPGYTSIRPNTAAPLAETLKLNGYSTAQFGKCHEVPVWETSPMGPFDAWPTGGGGFEYFYGFLGGETNQYSPALYEGTSPVEPDKTPEEGYHLTEDLDRPGDRLGPPAEGADARQAVLHLLRARRDPRPAPRPGSGRTSTGATSTAAGTRCARKPSSGRSELGVIPADAELTARHEEIPAWDDMPADLKPVLARQMEIYAGFLEHTDHHVGRLIKSLEDLEILDDTLVYYIIGDNGASAEGTVNGAFNECLMLNGASELETTEFMTSKIDDFGTPRAYNHYSVGWAHAMDTPYQWTKQVASHWGGTRNGTIVHWPGGVEAKGEVRSQFAHVIDVAATILDAAGIPEPTERQRRPADAAARPQHAAQLRRRRGAGVPRDAVLRDVRQPRHLPPGLDRLHPPQHAVAGQRSPAAHTTTTSGSSTPPTTGPRRTTSAPRTRRCWRSCSASS